MRDNANSKLELLKYVEYLPLFLFSNNQGSVGKKNTSICF